MDVLIVGSGAREHAIAWKVRQSPGAGTVYAAPGNPGIGQVAELAPLAIPKPGAPEAEIAAFRAELVRVARERRVELVVVGPEDPLAFGAVDALQAAGIRAFGPTAAAARIESSKAFAKELMRRHGIPMSESVQFDDFEAARAYVESRPGGVVVKADGLSAGKGTVVLGSREEAIEVLRALLLEGVMGAAGRRVVIEEILEGRETSAMAFTDGKTVAHMPFSCDHKPAFDGNRGPNTGGMGAYSPPVWIAEATAEEIRREVTEAAVRAMASAGTPFKGVLYPGLFITDAGLRVIEFNARFGDPEAEVLLPRLESDLLEIMLAVTDGTLDRCEVRWSEQAAVCVMLASGGYPGPYETGRPIAGLDEVDDDVLVFHAGTKRDERGRIVTGGGRVLGVTAMGPTVGEARERVYANVARIRFEGMHYRHDIGASEAAVPA
ncbi:MAG: phosphoribosylamine--glycine ligase [Dehalococcoidia bacterium]